MGQVTIEIPQNVNRTYQVDDSEFGEQLLQNLEDFKKKTKIGKLSAIIPPRRNSLKEDLANVVGIWADREESAEVSAIILPRRNSLKEDGDAVLGIWADNEDEADEIARKIREANRKVT